MGPGAREHHPHIAHPGQEEAAPVGGEGDEDDDDADDDEVDDVVPEGEDGAGGHQVPDGNGGWTWVDGKDGRGRSGGGTGWKEGTRRAVMRKEERKGRREIRSGAERKGMVRGKGDIDLTC